MAETADHHAHDEASKLIKKYAEEQQIRVELTEDQYNAILNAWNEKDPRKPARISFHVKDRAVAVLDVAGYRYRGNTCCV
ncbi:MAG TPA: hypothetical protein VF092_30105 [Longimicrobium sp.]